MKKFIIVGSKGAITYKDVFPLLKDGKVMLGFNNITTFQAPDGSVRKFGNIGWFTSLKCEKKGSLVLTKTYNEAYYPKYDNYDAIEVSKVKDIPYDYEGVMGVPVTFLDKWDGEGFEVEDMLCDSNNIGIPTYIDEQHKGYKGPVINGEALYHRILIKKKVEFEVVDSRGYTSIERLKNKDCMLVKDKDSSIDGKPTFARILIRRKR